MHTIIGFYKAYYFNIWLFQINLLALLICGFLAVSCHTKVTQANLIIENKTIISETAIDLNTASVEELEKLPQIGSQLARKIVEHREKYGPFRKPEHLILVPGISDQRFRQMRHLIKTE